MFGNQPISTPKKFKFNYHLVPGSLWFKLKTVIPDPSGDPDLDEYEENDAIRNIRAAGGVFVNDEFMDSMKQESGLLFEDGGWGSSKTTAIITKLLLSSLTQDRFKCYYGRQYLANTREFHDNIITEIKRNNWQRYFDYSEEPTGTLQIKCIPTGNLFIGFGCDKIDGSKGWDNPTCIVVDEINQIGFDTFTMLLTRLRGSGGKRLMIGMFNNPDVMPEHWLAKYIYASDIDLEGLDEKGRMLLESLKKINTTKHHSTYLHNQFQNANAYWHKIVTRAKGDIKVAEAYAEGLWGTKLGQLKYYKNFDSQKHVGICIYRPDLPLWLSWDDNVNPYQPMGVFQIHGNEIKMLLEFAGESPNNNVIWCCEQIKSIFGQHGYNHQSGMFITGDATARKTLTTTDSGMNYYLIIKDELSCFRPTLKVPSVNPNVAMRKDFINAIFGYNFGGLSITIDRSCKLTINDLNNIEENAETKGKEVGGKFKEKKKVNGISGVQIIGHFSDLFDYVVVAMNLEKYSQFQYPDGSKGKKTEHKPPVPKMQLPVNSLSRPTQNGLTRLQKRNGY